MEDLKYGVTLLLLVWSNSVMAEPKLRMQEGMRPFEDEL